MISEKTIDDFFEHTRALHAAGRAPFDIDQTCRWSFFFVDPSEGRLLELVPELEELGYEIAGTLAPDDDEVDGSYFLRADKIEAHTTASLLARNDQLYAMARRYGIGDYDGMDVGAIDGP